MSPSQALPGHTYIPSPGLCLALEGYCLNGLSAHIPFSQALVPVTPYHTLSLIILLSSLELGSFTTSFHGLGALRARPLWLGGSPSALLYKWFLHWSNRVHASHQALLGAASGLGMRPPPCVSCNCCLSLPPQASCLLDALRYALVCSWTGCKMRRWLFKQNSLFI